MFNKTNKTKHNFWGDVNPEKLKESPLTATIGKQLTDIVNPVKLLDQIFSTKSAESSQPENKSRIKANETVVFSHKLTHEDRKISQETSQILSELKKQVTVLQKSEKALSNEISKVKVDQLPPQAGIYYLRYFEWLSGLIRGLTVKINQGTAWLAAFNERSKKKMGYWKKYKKHGTTFGLSQERSLATQTG